MSANTPRQPGEFSTRRPAPEPAGETAPPAAPAKPEKSPKE